MVKKLLAIATLSLCTLAVAAPSHAQHRGGSAPATGRGVVRGGGSGVAVPRGSAPVFRGGGFYRPFYYPRYFYPGFSFGFNWGYPYYSPYYYPYGYYGLYGYPYGGYPYGGYPYGGYPYYGGYGSPDEARGLGGLRISDAPKDAQVYADGYYAGNVDDFNGTFQHLDLEAGPHHIELKEGGQTLGQVDVNIVPGETITYHAK
jgi:hypothetical protein